MRPLCSQGFVDHHTRRLCLQAAAEIERMQDRRATRSCPWSYRRSRCKVEIALAKAKQEDKLRRCAKETGPTEAEH